MLYVCYKQDDIKHVSSLHQVLAVSLLVRYILRMGFFYVSSFNTFSNSDFVVVGFNSPEVISDSVSSFQALMNHCITLQQLFLFG